LRAQVRIAQQHADITVMICRKWRLRQVHRKKSLTAGDFFDELFFQAAVPTPAG